MASSRRTETGVLAATILASGMVFVDISAVNVALPVIQTRLDATVTDLQYIVEAYQIFLAALLLLGGAAGDRYGRRRVFLLGLALFAAASAACGLAQTPMQLIVARGIQGIGAALLTPGSLALINVSIPVERRGRAIGTWAALSGLTAALGPLVGGLVTDTVSWRGIFFLNIPLALAVWFLTARFVDESRDEESPRRMDLAGAGTITAGLLLLVVGLLEGPQRGWDRPLVVGSLVAGTMLTAAFVVVELRVRQPMLPLVLFRNRTFATTNAATLLIYFALTGNIFFLPLNLIHVQGYSATLAGAALLPFLALLTLLSRTAGDLADRIGPRAPLAAGAFLTAGGFALMAVPGVGGSYWTTFFPAVTLLGLGMALVVAPLTKAVMASVPPHRSGVASGVNNAVSRVGGLLAVAVLGVIAFAVFDDALDDELPEGTLTSAQRAALAANRTSLAAAPVPEGLNATAQEHVRGAIDQSFVAAFRVVSLASAALTALGGVLAWALLPRGPEGSHVVPMPAREGAS